MNKEELEYSEEKLDVKNIHSHRLVSMMRGFEQINDPIEVTVLFQQRKTLPFKFIWGNREIVISKINLVYSSFEGKNKIYYFAVSDDVNYFKLEFNTENLNWTLLETYVE